MYGRKACQLVKEFASVEKGQLTPFNGDLLEQVVGECNAHHLELQSLIRKMQEEASDTPAARNADHYGALIHHLSLIRNKRCLMAYMYNRADTIRSLLWKIGKELPKEIEEKFCHPELTYFQKHSSALKSYMSRIDVDLTVDMVPPKDPYIQVRVLEDIGDGIVLNDKHANFTRHSMHFVKRTDVEQFISRGLMEELTN